MASMRAGSPGQCGAVHSIAKRKLSLAALSQRNYTDTKRDDHESHPFVVIGLFDRMKDYTF